MTSKERAFLRKNANGLDAIFQVGKDGIASELAEGVGKALKARELIKLRVLETAPVTAREAAEELAEKLNAEVVQVVGGRFVLYKKNKDINAYGV